MTGSADQLEGELKVAQAGEQEAKRQLAAGERVLTRVRDEKNKLQDSNTLLGEELKDVRAQLAHSMKENERLRGGIFSMLSNLPLCNSARKGTDRFMSAGMLTGRPEEEMSGSQAICYKSCRKCMSELSRLCGVLPRPCGQPPPLQKVWRSLYSYSEERGGVSDYGRYRPAVKVREKPGQW